MKVTVTLKVTVTFTGLAACATFATPHANSQRARILCVSVPLCEENERNRRTDFAARYPHRPGRHPGDGPLRALPGAGAGPGDGHRGDLRHQRGIRRVPGRRAHPGPHLLADGGRGAGFGLHSHLRRILRARRCRGRVAAGQRGGQPGAGRAHPGSGPGLGGRSGPGIGHPGPRIPACSADPHRLPDADDAAGSHPLWGERRRHGDSQHPPAFRPPRAGPQSPEPLPHRGGRCSWHPGWGPARWRWDTSSAQCST